MNQHSSRSHCILSLHLEIRPRTVNADLTAVHSTLHFCDLAGSERARKTGNQGHRLKESAHINR